MEERSPETGYGVARVIEVIDGDTIRVKDIETEEVFRVRYLGIDTPELDGLGLCLYRR